MQPPPANVRLTTFLQALRADLQRPVRTQEPQTLEAALHEARKAERIADSLYSGGRREQPFRRDEASAMTGNVPERGLLGPDGTPWRTRHGRDAAEAGEGARYQAGREAAGGQTRGTFAATMRTQPTDGRGRGDTMGGATRGREAQRTIGTQARQVDRASNPRDCRRLGSRVGQHEIVPGQQRHPASTWAHEVLHV